MTLFDIPLTPPHAPVMMRQPNLFYNPVFLNCMVYIYCPICQRLWLLMINLSVKLCPAAALKAALLTSK